MKKKRTSRFKATLSEGVSKYFTEETGWWGEMIDSMTQEERQSLMQSLIDDEPCYSERELGEEIEKAKIGVLRELRKNIANTKVNKDGVRIMSNVEIFVNPIIDKMINKIKHGD